MEHEVQALRTAYLVLLICTHKTLHDVATMRGHKAILGVYPEVSTSGPFLTEKSATELAFILLTKRV